MFNYNFEGLRFKSGIIPFWQRGVCRGRWGVDFLIIDKLSFEILLRNFSYIIKFAF